MTFFSRCILKKYSQVFQDSVINFLHHMPIYNQKSKTILSPSSFSDAEKVFEVRFE